MTVELVSPGEDLIETVASSLRPEEKDYSRSWIVFPEKRPAFYLRRALGERKKSGFVPPRVDSLDTFIDRVYAENLGIKDTFLEPLDAIALLFEIHKSSPHRLGKRSFLTADRFFPLGLKIYDDLEELNLAGARAEDVSAVDHLVEEKIPSESLRCLQTLSYFFANFFSTLERRGYSTPSSRFRRVAQEISPRHFPDAIEFLFAGFFSLAKMESELMVRMKDWPNVRFFFMKGKGIETTLARLGIENAGLGDGSNAGGFRPPIEFFRSADTHGELFALNQALEDKFARPASLDEKNVIVLPAAEILFPLFRHTLSRLSEEDYNISLGYPLERTPVWSFFHKLLEAVQSRDEDGRIYVPHYLAFILHPYTKNLYFPGPGRRADLTRILMHAVEDELTRRKAKAFWSLAELEADAEMCKTIAERVQNFEGALEVGPFLDHLHSIHAQTLDLFLEIRDVGDFAEKLIRVLNYIYENSTARLHQFFHPYAEAFMALLENLSRSLLRRVVFEDIRGYANLFRKVSAAGSVPFSGTPLRGLQVLGFWETRCIRFEDVSILDMNEGVMPATRRADTLLPFAVRKALGLPTYLDLEKRMEYYLDALLAGARRARLFFVENLDKERSRFIEKLLWQEQERDGEPRSDPYVRTVRYRVALQAGKTRPVSKTRAMVDFLRKFTYSATALDAYLSCPLRFYYSYVLGLEEKEEISERTEKKDIGILVHAILCAYFKKLAGRPLRVRDLTRRSIREAVGREFGRRYGKDVAGGPFLIRLQVQRHLEEFIQYYQIPMVRDLRARNLDIVIHRLEDTLQTSLKFSGKTFVLRAKLDRVETRGKDHYILDYKTGAREKFLSINFDKLDLRDREAWPAAIGSLQLPMYNLIAARCLKVSPESVRVRLLMLGKNRISPGIEHSPYHDDDPQTFRQELGVMETVIGTLLAEISEPGRKFEPCDDGSGTCAACPFSDICGR
jgi:ATP-dependent helicase/nuclease subunit B